MVRSGKPRDPTSEQPFKVGDTVRVKGRPCAYADDDRLADFGSSRERSTGSVVIMGLKDQLIEESNRDWKSTDGSVCAGCVEDEALKKTLRESGDEDLRCDFCGGVPAAPLDTLLEAFYNGLSNEYENALDGVGWDGREGGFSMESAVGHT